MLRLLTTVLIMLLLLLAATDRSAAADTPTPTPTPDRAALRAQAASLRQEANALYQQQDLAGALDKYGQALLIYARLGDLRNEALLNNDVAVVANAAGQFARALPFYQRAADIYRQLGDRPAEAVVVSNMALARANLGQREEAVTLYQQAAAIYRDLGDGAAEGGTLLTLAQVYYDMGRYQEALAAARQSAAVAERINDAAAQGRALWKMALVASALYQYQESVRLYEQAAAAFHRAGDLSSQATSLSLMATNYQMTGEWLKALDAYQQARALQQQIGDRAGESLTVFSIGLLQELLGQYTLALESFQVSLTLERSLGRRAAEAVVLTNVASIHASQGRYSQAIALYDAALQIWRELGDRRREGETLHNLARVYHAARDYDRALPLYEQALALEREIHNDIEVGALLHNIGLLHHHRGDQRQAIAFYEQALALHQQLGFVPRTWVTLNDMCLAYNALGEPGRALDLCRQSLQLQQNAGSLTSAWVTLYNIGYIQAGVGDVEPALASYQQAIEICESRRSAAAQEEERLGLGEQCADVYAQAVLLLVRLGKPEEAFNLAERARARSFLDRMGSARLDIRQGADAQLLAQEQNLRLELTAAETSLRRLQAQRAEEQQAERVALLTDRVASLRRSYSELLPLLKRTNPQYVSLVTVSPLSLAQVHRLLNKDTTLLSYFVTPQVTLAFIVTRTAFHAVQIPVTTDELQSAIAEFRDFATLAEAHPAPLQRLHQWLIGPILPYVKHSQLAIVPHSLLHYLPFAALTDGRRYLGAQHTIFYLPSASALSFIPQKRSEETAGVLVMAQSQAEGLPTLYYAADEAVAIARLFGSQPYVGSAATESVFASLAPTSHLIHLAAHGQLNTADPLFSRIVLAPSASDDGLLHVQEIYGLDIGKADMVVLSACQSQLGAYSRGDDVIGLNRAFMYAGASTVVASLWSVDDQATQYLMTRLYDHLKQGMAKAEALRVAQAETCALYPHPYYWAAFTLTGDPGQGSASLAPMAVVGAAVLVLCLAAGVGALLLRRRRRATIARPPKAC